MRKNRTPEKEEEKEHPRSRFQREAAVVEATEACGGGDNGEAEAKAKAEAEEATGRPKRSVKLV